jgi:pimeloyl-ACP methyl ester carboxylesterase
MATSNRQPLYIEVQRPEAGQTTPWYIAGWLTVPEEHRRNELQILLHGACYDHRYWDWPEQPETYSYVTWAKEHGLATLAIDRVGSGWSSHPPGLDNTIAAQSAVLELIVRAARTGFDGIAAGYEQIVLIGHSLGSLIAGYHAALANDVDSVVLTGYLPVDGPPESETKLLDGAFLPALEGLPYLRGLVDENYMTPFPEMREALMYRAGQADPDIIRVDEAIKGTTTRGELFGTAGAGPVVRISGVPTLVLVGQYDVLLMNHERDVDCNDASRRVSQLSPPHFTFSVVNETGHNLNLHRNARQTYELIGDWLDKRHT